MVGFCFHCAIQLNLKALMCGIFTIFHLKLDERSVQTASGILQQLGEVMQATQRRMRSKRIDDRFLLSQEFIQTMTRVTSNLIEAASILIQRYTPQYQHTNSPNWSLHISCCTR